VAPASFAISGRMASDVFEPSKVTRIFFNIGVSSRVPA
jgi:hypothetical protein